MTTAPHPSPADLALPLRRADDLDPLVERVGMNSWVRGRGDARDARAVLAGFDRWPTWMWANHEVADLATSRR